MTGREMMMFILENKLENEDIFSDKVLSSICMTVNDAAVKFDTGVATIHSWVQMGLLPAFKMDGITYIYEGVHDPRENESAKYTSDAGASDDAIVLTPGSNRITNLIRKSKVNKKTYIRLTPKTSKEMTNETENSK